ncbi:hypothetical protein HOY82DRAFT_493051 [Tuber indicum]|nr:hypothetical protein HOY82DRAFT_493051 [Tuber indicum]
MLTYMDYLQNAFYRATSWDPDNSYVNLTATARALLDFPTPRGLKMDISSLSTPKFGTSYSLSNLGVVDGSVSYLYSSLPLHNVHRSEEVDLHDVTMGYRQLEELRSPDNERFWEVWKGGVRVDGRNTLLFGRMYLPASTLEALYLRRMKPTTQFRITGVSDGRLKSGGTIMAMMQHDFGKWSGEYLYSTDGALIGARGLYNFGRDPRKQPNPPPRTSDEKAVGRFSMGAEFYYGILNKSAGMSTGLRYTTLPTHPNAPTTMTLTLTPLMGSLSATYAIKAGEAASFCSRFDFNMYSYESDLSLGCEVWRREDVEKEDFAGVLKARVSQTSGIGLLWEGRLKHLLFSLGAGIDLRRKDQLVRAVGLELQYSS